MKLFRYLFALLLPFCFFAEEVILSSDQPQDQLENSSREEVVVVEKKQPESLRWYFSIKPGYFTFSDGYMRNHFHNGGFMIKAEIDYQVLGPLLVWVDGGCMWKEGQAIGGREKADLKLATLTLGLKGRYSFNDTLAIYGALGPRLFMMLLHNDSPFVRSEDNQVGIGGGICGRDHRFPFCQKSI